MTHWNEERDRAKVIDEIYPLESTSYALKNMQKIMGSAEFPESMSLEEKEKILEEMVQSSQKTIKELKDMTQNKEQSYRDQADAHREKVIKETSFNPEKPVKEIKNWPSVQV